MFTATKLQTATYLLAVCPFSIAFLVFMNSSVSFVITDLIGLSEGHGDAAGTLGFADELLALVACPTWGIISDHVGVRYVCCAGYAVIALSLVLFVQAKNVYPELLLGRLLFCLGGSAVATMVTAVLPSVTAPRKSLPDSAAHSGADGGEYRHLGSVDASQECAATSISLEHTLTQEPSQSRLHAVSIKEETLRQGSPSKLAGFVGALTGCGALLALFVFLPLPARFEKFGLSPAQAIKQSYYVVAFIAGLVSIVCFLGLRHLEDEQGKGLGIVIQSFNPTSKRAALNRPVTSSEAPTCRPNTCRWRHLSISGAKSYFTQLATVFAAGFKNANIGLGYIGGFVARASSVGISLFIPLYVNQYYRTYGLCRADNPHDGADGPSKQSLGDIKKSCPEAYIVASILSGVSQLIALLSAPAFGFLSEKSRICHLPLLAAAFCGIVGYIVLALLPSPQIGGDHSSAPIFIDMALIGISQIGAIVCSLAVLGNGILAVKKQVTEEDENTANDDCDHCNDGHQVDDEYSSLLPISRTTEPDNLSHLKGSIAGMYSLFGGAGILLLTKLGGLLFDRLSPRSPFYILAIFNGLLLAIGLIHGLRQLWKMKPLTARMDG
ncbi:hypothetical protein VTO42DRAFT_5253 [Malbranchea cinnamomea]